MHRALVGGSCSPRQHVWATSDVRVRVRVRVRVICRTDIVNRAGDSETCVAAGIAAGIRSWKLQLAAMVAT